MEFTQEETDQLVAEYFSKGGVISKIPSHRKARPTLRLFHPERYRTIHFDI